MKCSISTYYKILDAELYDFDDGYMQLNIDINAKKHRYRRLCKQAEKECCGDV